MGRGGIVAWVAELKMGRGRLVLANAIADSIRSRPLSARSSQSSDVGAVKRFRSMAVGH